MAKYNATLLETFADRLYTKAALMAFKCALIGALIGLSIGSVPAILLQNRIDERIENRYKATGNGFNVPLQNHNNDSDFVGGILLLGGFVGSVAGFLVGQRKAFEYRLQAQVTLCQVQIESNTRQGVQSHPAGS